MCGKADRRETPPADRGTGSHPGRPRSDRSPSRSRHRSKSAAAPPAAANWIATASATTAPSPAWLRARAIREPIRCERGQRGAEEDPGPARVSLGVATVPRHERRVAGPRHCGADDHERQHGKPRRERGERQASPASREVAAAESGGFGSGGGAARPVAAGKRVDRRWRKWVDRRWGRWSLRLGSRRLSRPGRWRRSVRPVGGDLARVLAAGELMPDGLVLRLGELPLASRRASCP